MERLATLDDFAGESFLDIKRKTLLNQLWKDIFDVDIEMQSLEDDAAFRSNPVQSIIDTACTFSTAISLLYEEVLIAFLKVCHKQFRKDVKSTLHVRRKEAHRIAIQQRKQRRKRNSLGQAARSTPNNDVRSSSSELEGGKCEVCESVHPPASKKKKTQWCQCDGCEAWYHQECAKLSNAEYKSVTKSVWLCSECYSRMDQMYP